MKDLNAGNEFDYVIAGGGAAGLSLAYRLTFEKFKDYKIALVDPDIKSGIDHTWCSWLKGDNIFDNCAKNNFNRIKVAGKGFDKDYEISPYRYRMIESSKFYDFVNTAIDSAQNIKRFKSKIKREK